MSAATLRVLTLNLWNVSEPYAERMAAVRAGLAALQPDIIGFQEVIVRRDGLDQGADALGGLGYEARFAAAWRWHADGDPGADDGEGDAFGNLIASRWPIVASERRALPGEESGESRCALAAHIESPYGIVPVVCTHLNWKLHHGVIRERQVIEVAALAEEWARGAAFPPLIIGDLNAEPDATEIRFLCGLTSLAGRSTYFQDAWRVRGDGGPGYTWDNRNPYAATVHEPDRRLDYILVGLPEFTARGVIARAALAFTEPLDGVWASDHFGVVADIRTG